MDKYEYKVRSDEIKTLISQGDYAEAVKIADSIDWRRVKSVMMLCTISDLYKINRRYEDSKNILLLAYERHTGGRRIVYSLCELSIKLGEYVQALEYYKEFVQLAPKDSGKYVLQYKLYESQEVSLEERIGVLEELKKEDYREKWGYELACLYHKVGLASKCVAECDDIFLWFGEGRYVLKALELKMQHEHLNTEQQIKYEQMKQTGGFVISDDVPEQEMQENGDVDVQADEIEEEDEEEFSLEENILSDNTQEVFPKDELDIRVKTIDMSKYNTINLQQELAESMRQFLEENKTREVPTQEVSSLLKTKVYEPVAGLDSRIHPVERTQEISFGQENVNRLAVGERPAAEAALTDEVQLSAGELSMAGWETAEEMQPVVDRTEAGEALSMSGGTVAEEIAPASDRVVEEEMLTMDISAVREMQLGIDKEAEKRARPAMSSAAEDRVHQEHNRLIKESVKEPEQQVLGNEVMGETQPILDRSVIRQMQSAANTIAVEQIPPAVDLSVAKQAQQAMDRAAVKEASPAAGKGVVKEVWPIVDKPDRGSKETGQIQTVTDEAYVPKKKPGDEEVFFGNTEEVDIQEVISQLAQQNSSGRLFTPLNEQMQGEANDASEPEKKISLAAAGADAVGSNAGVIRNFHKKSGYDNMLTQDDDGQISLVVPEEEKIEKQITGQLSIEDIMAEWERMKQENERKRMEEIRQRVQQQTDTLFADFDEATKSGLLEELEKAMVSAALKEEKMKTAKERTKFAKAAAANVKETTENKKATAQKQALEGIVDTEPLKETQPSEDMAKDVGESQKDKEEIEKGKQIEKDRRSEEVEEDESDLSVETEDVSSDGAEEEEEISSDELPAEETGVEEDPTEEDTAENEEISVKGKKAKRKDLEKRKAAISKPPKEKETNEEKEEEGDGKDAVREMTDSEREQFAPFIHHKRTKKQIVEVLDNVNIASNTGNVVITGEEKSETVALAKLLMRNLQLVDDDFSGKVAKVSGTTMNKKDVADALAKLSGGALIIESASSMKKSTVGKLLRQLDQEEEELIVLMEDTKVKMENFLNKYPDLKNIFNLRVDVEALDDRTLVKYARKYALEQEYTIDELGMLALHTRIADMQTSDHEVTLTEIEELVDEAIYYADKKTPKHFFDVLLGKRYDDDDMIVLREKDFMHY